MITWGTRGVGVKVISRPDWQMPGPLGLPMKSSRGFWLHHSVTKPSMDATADARTVARIGVGRFGRLSYSWLVHPDGTIFQGQDGHTGAHTRGQNSTTEAICCVGNFDVDQPSEAMLRSVSLIVAMRGVPLLGGHRDAPGASTVCPGRNLHRAIPGVREGAEFWEGWQTKPGWVTDESWRNLLAYVRSSPRFPPP